MTSEVPPDAELRFITYHEIAEENSGDIYRVSRVQLKSHLIMLRGLNLGYAGHRVTFDDGHISNYDFALPLMEELGFRAIFFITTSWIGAENRLSEAQVRELLKMGHQIGSHSCTHAFLNECSDQKLHEELLTSRKRLEDVLGCSIRTISIPYGRWDRRVLRACMTAGYSKVFTSDPWLPASAREGVDVLGRLTIRNSVDVNQLRHFLTARGLVKARLQMPFKMKQALRACVGDRMYHRIWHVFANREETSRTPSYGVR